MRVVAAVIMLMVIFVTGLANARPTLAEPTWLRIGVARLADLIAEGRGPGWHWSNRRGWDWGLCVRDWPPV